MSVRLRRLYAEYERLKVLFADHERIRIVEALGDPPDRYVVEYRVKGLVDNKGSIEESSVHRIRITLGPNYPNEMASYVAITPIFHPNIDHLAVCTADQDAASTKIEDNIVFIGRMITFQDYNLQSPRNGDAAKWTATNLGRLPLERVNLWPSKALEGAAMPLLRPDQIPASSEVGQPREQLRCANCRSTDAGAGLHECSNHHLICNDCTLNCANCNQALCVLCSVRACSECRQQVCAECAATCATCHRTVCPLHAIQCSVCRAIRCHDCSAACSGCGGRSCVEHLDQARLCPPCSKRASDALAAARRAAALSLASAGPQAAADRSEVPLSLPLAKEPPVQPSESPPPPPPVQAGALGTPIRPSNPAPAQNGVSAINAPIAFAPVAPAALAPAQKAAPPPSPPHFDSPFALRPNAAPPPSLRTPPLVVPPPEAPRRVEALVSPYSPPVPRPTPADDGFARSSPRVVITAEEALRVPQSALIVPDARLQIAPSAEPCLSGKAIASLVFGILGLPVVGLLVGWFALWFGIMAIRQIDQSGRLRGRGMAIVGITLGIAGIILWVILVAAYGPSLFTSRFANVPPAPVRFQ